MAANFRSDVYEGGTAAAPNIGPGVAATIGAILPRFGTTELWQKFGALDTDWVLMTTTGAVFPPTRVALVDPARGNDATGVYGGIPYATIAGALADAPALTPTATDPLVIWCAPDTYTDALTLVSNVHLSALPGSDASVVVSGACTWTAAAGVNAPQAAARELLTVSGITFTNTTTVTTTAKALEVAVLEVRECTMGATAITMRTPGDTSDETRIFDSTVSGAFSAAGGIQGAVGTTFNSTVDLTASADTTFRACRMNQIVTLATAANLVCMSCIARGAVNVGAGVTAMAATGSIFDTVSTTGAGASIECHGCAFTGAITAIAGSAIDVRMCTYPAGALAGAGTIDRTITRITGAASAIGANNEAIAPPLPNNNYAVTFTASAGSVAAFPPVLGALTGANIAYTDTTANQVYEILITKE